MDIERLAHQIGELQGSVQIIDGEAASAGRGQLEEQDAQEGQEGQAAQDRERVARTDSFIAFTWPKM